MTFGRTVRLFILLVLAATVSACQTTTKPPVVLSKKSAVELRVMQSRAFETSDEVKVVRSIVATFLDLGYIVDKVEPGVGTVSATKLAHLKMTAVASQTGPQRTVVRANAIVDMPPQIRQQVDAPEFYQTRFFEPLSKALFLSALEVMDDEATPEVPLPPEPAEKQPEDKDAPEEKTTQSVTP